MLKDHLSTVATRIQSLHPEVFEAAEYLINPNPACANLFKEAQNLLKSKFVDDREVALLILTKIALQFPGRTLKDRVKRRLVRPSAFWVAIHEIVKAPHMFYIPIENGISSFDNPIAKELLKQYQVSPHEKVNFRKFS